MKYCGMRADGLPRHLQSTCASIVLFITTKALYYTSRWIILRLLALSLMKVLLKNSRSETMGATEVRVGVG